MLVVFIDTPVGCIFVHWSRVKYRLQGWSSGQTAVARFIFLEKIEVEGSLPNGWHIISKKVYLMQPMQKRVCIHDCTVYYTQPIGVLYDCIEYASHLWRHTMFPSKNSPVAECTSRWAPVWYVYLSTSTVSSRCGDADIHRSMFRIACTALDRMASVHEKDFFLVLFYGRCVQQSTLPLFCVATRRCTISSRKRSCLCRTQTATSAFNGAPHSLFITNNNNKRYAHRFWRYGRLHFWLHCFCLSGTTTKTIWWNARDIIVDWEGRHCNGNRTMNEMQQHSKIRQHCPCVFVCACAAWIGRLVSCSAIAVRSVKCASVHRMASEMSICGGPAKYVYYVCACIASRFANMPFSTLKLNK